MVNSFSGTWSKMALIWFGINLNRFKSGFVNRSNGKIWHNFFSVVHEKANKEKCSVNLENLVWKELKKITTWIKWWISRNCLLIYICSVLRGIKSITFVLYSSSINAAFLFFDEVATSKLDVLQKLDPLHWFLNRPGWFTLFSKNLDYELMRLK